jgi:formylglycine-generating enzyme required for sulfatase activity
MGTAKPRVRLFLMLLLLAGVSLAGQVDEHKSLPSNTSSRESESLGDLPEKAIVAIGGVKLELVLVRPGIFLMGSLRNVEGDENPHWVTITEPFYIGRYEVTQEQWYAATGTKPSTFDGKTNPVETVSWYDCQDFARKLSGKVGGAGFRLPSEAEWEYACRAGSVTAFCYGDDVERLGDYAWYDDRLRSVDGVPRTHEVGQKEPNAWGLYDMHGNVWEWCQDYYSPYGVDNTGEPQASADMKLKTAGHRWAISGGGQTLSPQGRSVPAVGTSHMQSH